MLILIHINEKSIIKFLGGHAQKCLWHVWSQDFKIDCISRMNTRNEIVLHAGKES